MKVMIDWVVNHTGYDHQWTTKYAEFYRKDEKGNFTDMHGWIDVIDLDYAIPEMCWEIITSMKYGSGNLISKASAMIWQEQFP